VSAPGSTDADAHGTIDVDDRDDDAKVPPSA